MLLLSGRVIVDNLELLTTSENSKVLIVDDSLYQRDRSDKVELLARVHDHNTGRYHRGFTKEHVQQRVEQFYRNAAAAF